MFTRPNKQPACIFRYAGPAAEIAKRQILGLPLSLFHFEEMEAVRVPGRRAPWQVFLGDRLLFDRSALQLIDDTIAGYRGDADRLRVWLRVEDSAYRQYYSLAGYAGDSSLLQTINMPIPSAHLIRLPMTAQRTSGGREAVDDIYIDLPLRSQWLATPSGLCEPFVLPLPTALLLPHRCDFDFLFANQVAYMAKLFRRIPLSPRALTKGLLWRRSTPWRQRVSAGFKRIHRSARVHPTAVVEGSIIGPNAQIGAHCVVRYSMICAETKLHDGAKAEFSVVGQKAWLMHDVVLYRSYTEDNVYLVHGPYQYSGFQSKSSASAAIMMDHRADERPIRVDIDGKALAYTGRFLGAILREGAKAVEGSLTAPGSVIESNTIRLRHQSNAPEA